MKIKIDKAPTVLDFPPLSEMKIKIIRLPAVLDQSCRCKTAHFADVKEGLMPSGIKLGARAVGYLQHEIDAVLRARIAGKTPEEIKRLVQALEAKRKGFL